ncbi:hypothetical protein EYS39_17540 [Cronobacter sakazakii]|uniref:hypothetical protein n=1 Tax=Cronobacter sakazakii TaxID=28141 RepID=UPI00115CC4D5|nr:hypothetical protein [Cronobacter sakazakii]TQQ86769.1 hypothetical protein EYS39_17540 [Cronobacter sakazakii]
MKPNRYLSWKETIDFEKLNSERKTIDTDLRSKRECIDLYPDSKNRLEKEIADLNTRILELDALLAKEPLLPELPPLQPLVKVSGILDEIQTMVVKGYFSAREYEPDEFARQESRRQWGSVLLAAIGESAAATVNAQDEIRSADVYHLFRAKLTVSLFTDGPEWSRPEQAIVLSLPLWIKATILKFMHWLFLRCG